METFAEFVAASFESIVDLFWDYPRRGLATAKFGVRDIAIIVTFEEPEPTAPWRVEFEVQRGDSNSAVYAAFEIFNGVMQAVEEFLNVREPGELVIVSKSEQLARIYETYLKRESGRLERLGYSFEGLLHKNLYTEFTLRRSKASGWNRTA
jgi:hypothetical protein